jgi:alkanesulfonate monooxygenase SsuD/methylene tetrahydromethanopterin reductase-like flavin-dependent oxidoreductase (luciferase family)
MSATANADRTVRFGLGVPNGGDFADPQRLARLASEAELAGWDGFFLWDHVIRRAPWQPMVDPWVTLAAVATTTDRIVLGPMVTPLARRRVSVVARQSVTLDRLSEGRLRLGVGLGAPDDEFTRFGEDADPRRRARILDESLDALGQLWSGRPVRFRGEYVVADGVQFEPTPVAGRIPIWVAGGWPGGAPFRRAARHDGVWPVSTERRALTVEEFADCVTSVDRHRREIGRAAEAFDACFVDRSPAVTDDRTLDRIDRLAAVGMTWWIDSLDDPTIPFEDHRERVLAGPPRNWEPTSR